VFIRVLILSSSTVFCTRVNPSCGGVIGNDDNASLPAVTPLFCVCHVAFSGWVLVILGRRVGFSFSALTLLVGR